MRKKRGNKSDETYDNGTTNTVQPLLNMWVSDKVSKIINISNNNFNSNNINNNNNNNILTNNKSSERRHNNIDIDNCFYHIPDVLQRAVAHMNMEVMYSVVDRTLYNGEGLRKCSHYNNNNTMNNKNTINIYSNNDISELIFADINTFPVNNITSEPTTVTTHHHIENNNNYYFLG